MKLETHSIRVGSRGWLRSTRKGPRRTLARATRTPRPYRASRKTILARTSHWPLDFRGRVGIYRLLPASFRPPRFAFDRLLGIRAVDRRLLRRGRRGRGHSHLHASMILEIAIRQMLGMLRMLGLDVGMLLFGRALRAHRLGRQGARETMHRICVCHCPRWSVCASWSASRTIVGRERTGGIVVGRERLL